jgi:hypothetical protein
MPAPWPAAGAALAFLQLLPGAANATFSGHRLLGVLDPADELVAGQRSDVIPGIKGRPVGDECGPEIRRKRVHYSTRHSLAAHRTTLAVRRGWRLG